MIMLETEYFPEVCVYRLRLLCSNSCTANRKTSNVRPEYLPHLSSAIILNRDLRLLDNIGRGEIYTVRPTYYYFCHC